MELVGYIFACLFIILGVVVFIIGVIGVYQFKFVLNRMHSAALLDTMGLFFVALGCAIARNFDAITIKILIVVGFLWITSPLSSHLIAKLEFFTDENLNDEITNDLSETKEDNNDSRDL